MMDSAARARVARVALSTGGDIELVAQMFEVSTDQLLVDLESTGEVPERAYPKPKAPDLSTRQQADLRRRLRQGDHPSEVAGHFGITTGQVHEYAQPGDIVDGNFGLTASQWSYLRKSVRDGKTIEEVAEAYDLPVDIVQRRVGTR